MRYECSILVEGKVYFTADEEYLHDLYVELATVVGELEEFTLGPVKAYDTYTLDKNLLEEYVRQCSSANY
jgi:hypothetical protein